MRALRTILTTLAASTALLLPLPALAADPPAQILFDQGVAALEAGQFEHACPAIEESYKLDPLPGTLFTLAECEAKRGRLATALRHYDEYLSIYGTLSPERKAKQQDREKVCRAQRAALTPRVPELTLALPPNAPQGTVVTRDGVVVEKPELGVPIRVDPGDHLIQANAPGGPPSTTRITLAEGDRRGIALVVPPVDAHMLAADASGMGPSSASGTDWRLVAGIAGVTIGAALVGTGVFSTIKVHDVDNDSAFVEYKQLEGPAVANVCAVAAQQNNATILNDCSTVRTFTTVQKVAYPVAAAFLGAGIYFLATRTPTQKPGATILVVTPSVGFRFGGVDMAVRF